MRSFWVGMQAVPPGGKRPILVGEFGLAGLEEIEGLIDAVVEQQRTGALIWSLRNHDSHGGWHWHCEAGGTCAYHYPGFASGDAYNENAVLTLLREAAWDVRGEPIPKPAALATPTLLPVETPLDIAWQGVVGASAYDIARSSDDQSWEIVGTDIPDSVNHPDIRVRRTFVDPQSGRVHTGALGRILFQDNTAQVGQTLFYRVRAKGPRGISDWSTHEQVTIAIDTGVTILTRDEIDAFKTVARFTAPANLTRI